MNFCILDSHHQQILELKEFASGHIFNNANGCLLQSG